MVLRNINSVTCTSQSLLNRFRGGSIRRGGSQQPWLDGETPPQQHTNSFFPHQVHGREKRQDEQSDDEHVVREEVSEESHVANLMTPGVKVVEKTHTRRVHSKKKRLNTGTGGVGTGRKSAGEARRVRECVRGCKGRERAGGGVGSVRGTHNIQLCPEA